MSQIQDLEITEKLRQVIPGGVSSPVRAFCGMEMPPMIVDSAKEDLVFDIEGHAFIDYCMSWGAIIHGHSHPAILEGLRKQMEKGTTFGITSLGEERLARKIVELVDSVEKVRFVNSGTEAAMSAVRLARGYTKRDLVIKFNGNYHGHADFFLVRAGSGVTGVLSDPSSAGVPQDVVKHVVSLPYNDVKTARRFLKENAAAAVIVEPIAANMGVVPSSQDFLEMLREETEHQGALLIFDEVITGFRVALKGAQSIYRIAADLTCFGKVIGGGLPLAAFGGKKEIMDYLAPDGPVYQAGTLSGNPLATEAGFQALRLLETGSFFSELQRKTCMITDPVYEWMQKNDFNGCLQKCGSCFTIFFGARSVSNHEEARQLNLRQFAAFFRHMYANGIYIPPSQFESWFVSMAHTEDHLEKTKDKILEFLRHAA